MDGGAGGGSGLPKNIFWPFGPQFGLKIRREGGGPSLGSVTATDFKQECCSGRIKLSNVWQKNVKMLNIALLLDSKGF